jgi:hypothetical protein
MVTIKVKNCKLNGRNNQNTSFFISEMKYGFTKGDVVTPEWVLENLTLIKKDIEKQNNTTVQIEQR